MVRAARGRQVPRVRPPAAEASARPGGRDGQEPEREARAGRRARAPVRRARPVRAGECSRPNCPNSPFRRGFRPRWRCVSGFASGCASHDRLQLAGGRLGGKGPQLVRREAERRREEDGDRLSGQVPRPGGNEHEQEELVRPEGQRRDDEGPRTLPKDGGVGGAERPRAVPEVVARSGYEEGDRRGGEIVETDHEQRRIDGEVDRVARGTDRAEADELVLEQTARRADRHLLTVAPRRSVFVGRSAGNRPSGGLVLYAAVALIDA